jgi:hypothetical protein
LQKTVQPPAESSALEKLIESYKRSANPYEEPKEFFIHAARSEAKVLRAAAEALNDGLEMLDIWAKQVSPDIITGLNPARDKARAALSELAKCLSGESAIGRREA